MPESRFPRLPRIPPRRALRDGVRRPTRWTASGLAALIAITVSGCDPLPARGQADSEPKQVDRGPLEPDAERLALRVPEGFEVERVAAESEGIGKFITTCFDAKGRLWTMTALEYPVDANENPEASRRLFERGGRDQVLIIDRPFDTPPSAPRPFVTGLVMPLGILPYRDGVFVQYGHDIRWYRDRDGDGTAESHEVVLTGFGTEDSHLFPHQFTRVPGDAILTGQGLFNYSKVRRPDGRPFADGAAEVVFNQCKLARFAPDGSRFELLTAGPNNIWGLTLSREGETWIQEANDIGYPIIPFEPGGYYATGSSERLRAYQPLMPAPLAPAQMGGTGLSGLALADDRDGWPDPWGAAGTPDGERRARYFYVANPITSRIQRIRAAPSNGRYVYEKLPDFLVSEDVRFRPVAIQFGPDGCLYVTDWYNKVISHNEVPREHPERDKIRGRIWRIRRTDQPRRVPPDLTRLTDEELERHLGSPNARIADLAWQVIADRHKADPHKADPHKADPHKADRAWAFEALALDASVPADRRLGALWAWEGFARVPDLVLMRLARDANAQVRREAIRIAGAQPRGEAEFLAIAGDAVDDPSPRVRAAFGDALRRVPIETLDGASLVLRFSRPPLAGPLWDAYDREFERYLARWAMETHRGAVARFLESPAGRAFPPEHRALATLALEGRDAAIGLARVIPELARRLNVEEIRVLAAHFGDPEVAKVLDGLLAEPASRAATLRTLLSLRADLDTGPLAGPVERASRALWSGSNDPADRELVILASAAWRLKRLDAEIASFAESRDTPLDARLLALRGLREIGSDQGPILMALITRDGEPSAVRTAALNALAESDSETSREAMIEIMAELPFELRGAAIDRLATHRNGCRTLLAAMDAGLVDGEDLSASVLENLRSLVPGDARIESLWSEFSRHARPVLRLTGKHDDGLAAPIALEGPFTVETWIRLKPGIDNTDGILCRPGVLDINFHDATPRVWITENNDIAIADRRIAPDAWTHIAVTRDASGVFRIFVNGEPSARSSQANAMRLTDLRIGRTIPPRGGTDGELVEYRIWNVARSPEAIRNDFDRTLAEGHRPEGLVHLFTGNAWGELTGAARVESSGDSPELLSPSRAAGQSEKFARFRALAEQPGDPARGKELFRTQCSVCHSYRGQGGSVGPVLDGIGVLGTESVLRNVLTPNAAMEGGYRTFRVVTFDGRIVQGLLVAQDEESVVVRQPNTSDVRIAKNAIERAGFLNRSIMPEGLLEGLERQQVSDLFAYLRSLAETRPAPSP